ncbi:MAG: hypothetical protein JOY57_16120, partial [Actinobacteria bacterium]|nr:hypothetical protein [Actinomycetota bacterium]
MMVRRLLSAAVAACIVVTIGAGAARAQTATSIGSGQPSNEAVAVNTKDGSSVFKLAFS